MSASLAPLLVLSLKGNRWLDKPAPFSDSRGNYLLLVSLLFASHGHEFENNRSKDNQGLRRSHGSPNKGISMAVSWFLSIHLLENESRVDLSQCRGNKNDFKVL